MNEMIIKARSWCGTNLHFVITTVILAIAAGGWNVAVEQMKLATYKIPVPWPASVVVDEETFRNKSFPVEIGPYKLANGGERNIEDLTMEALGVGTPRDKDRVGNRRSNWTLSRIYSDTRKTGDDALVRNWRLDITYYTGSADKVPHYAEECILAGGASIISSQTHEFIVAGLAPPWDGPIPFRITWFNVSDPRRQTSLPYVQYQVFCINGRAESDRLKVRMGLMYPWVKHCYYAKIQFAPIWPISEHPEAKAELNRSAQEFINYFLPHVLESLPSVKEIKRLDAEEEN